MELLPKALFCCFVFSLFICKRKTANLLIIFDLSLWHSFKEGEGIRSNTFCKNETRSTCVKMWLTLRYVMYCLKFISISWKNLNVWSLTKKVYHLWNTSFSRILHILCVEIWSLSLLNSDTSYNEHCILKLKHKSIAHFIMLLEKLRLWFSLSSELLKNSLSM